jgi:hypothetical protein
MNKITFLMLVLMALALDSFTQGIPTKNREIGLCLNAPSSFGIRYRTGGENLLIRFTLLSINGNNNSDKYNSNQATKNSSGGIGLNFGLEKRKSITNSLGFYIGSDLLMSYSKNSYENPQTPLSNKSWTISPGLGLVLGFVYKINEDINISAEVVPSIVYSYSKSTTVAPATDITQIGKGFSYGLTNSVGSLTLSFTLGKKN